MNRVRPVSLLSAGVSSRSVRVDEGVSDSTISRVCVSLVGAESGVIGSNSVKESAELEVDFSGEDDEGMDGKNAVVVGDFGQEFCLLARLCVTGTVEELSTV